MHKRVQRRQKLPEVRASKNRTANENPYNQFSTPQKAPARGLMMNTASKKSMEMFNQSEGKSPLKVALQ